MGDTIDILLENKSRVDNFSVVTGFDNLDTGYQTRDHLTQGKLEVSDSFLEVRIFTLLAMMKSQSIHDL